ncbi:MAG: oligosaccharide flippase family protein [Deferribacteraceae bacterium]|nr:oligosaccharide flippase family protein [Deferribacteraceae bacterium]
MAIIKKGNKLQTLLKDSFVYGLTFSLSKFAYLLLIPIYTRFLTVGMYGALDTLLLIGAMLNIIFLAGQEEALGRFYYDALDEKKGIIGAVFSNILLASLLLTALLFFFSEQLTVIIFNSNEYLYEFRLILLYSFSTALLIFFRSLARWEFKKKSYFFLTLAPTISIIVLTFIAVKVLNLGIRGALYSQIISNTLFVLIGFSLFRFSPPKKRFFIPLLKYGIPIMITISLASLYNVIDKAFYIHIFGGDTLGLYSLGGRFALFIALPQSAFWAAWAPLIFSTYKDRDSLDTINNTLLLFSALFSLALVLQFSFAEIIVKIISNAVYLEGIKFALPLAFLIVLEGSSNISSIGIELEKKTYINALILAGGAILAIALIFLLTPLFSAPAIAYALLLSKVFTTTARIIISSKISSLHLKVIRPYLALALSFLLSFISINLNSPLFAVILFRAAAIALMLIYLAVVLRELGLLKMRKMRT